MQEDKAKICELLLAALQETNEGRGLVRLDYEEGRYSSTIRGRYYNGRMFIIKMDLGRQSGLDIFIQLAYAIQRYGFVSRSYYTDR